MYSCAKIVITAVVTVACTACSMTLPVKGQVTGSSETFSGTAIGHLSGGGNLEIVSSQGAVCKGNFVYVNGRQGEGVFSCDDGRSGPFSFVSTGTAGTGHGTLNQEKIIFTFGKEG